MRLLRRPGPYKDGSAQELRDRQPNDTGLTGLTLEEVTDHYAQIAAKLQEKPIIIGHSLGGLITQVLRSRGLSIASFAIHAVPSQAYCPMR